MNGIGRSVKMFGRTDAAKSETAAPRGRSPAAPIGWLRQCRRADPTATAFASNACRTGIARIPHASLRVAVESGIVGVAAPLPNVACHVVQSERRHSAPLADR